MRNYLTTDQGTFSIGELVIYSDLSPWEAAVIVGFENDNVTLQFTEDPPHQPLQDCMPDGLRKYTPENLKLLS